MGFRSTSSTTLIYVAVYVWGRSEVERGADEEEEREGAVVHE